ncbi:hypothetical protein DYBT9275_00694 [Dyadobacter sp. CECT 9275]|uniref:Uncharacterized protein n=1 Tax=Dyadobacter helix TaxID=2822344 RepID=A0A916N2R2_9BACT|nr:hypothetical protein DYBT9275_00694 [Dyadobacter sp. CECT 9275]
MPFPSRIFPVAGFFIFKKRMIKNQNPGVETIIRHTRVLTAFDTGFFSARL